MLKCGLMERKRTIWASLIAIGGVVFTTLARRHRTISLTLPDAGEIAAETAVSVHNAAKATVIAAIREADHPDSVLLSNTARDAMREGVVSGADLAAVAVGIVEGAVQVSRLLGEDAVTAGSTAAQAAMEVAEAQGRVAAARIHDMLAPHGLVE